MNNAIIAIIIMAITLFSIVGINDVVSNQQELSNINEIVIEKQLEKIQEKMPKYYSSRL